MELKIGDLVSSSIISLGDYLGSEEIKSNGKITNFIKIYDRKTKSTHFIPSDRGGELKKLPSEASVKKYLKVINEPDLIEVKEIEGSRYKFLHQKFMQGKLKQSLEVWHDISIINQREKIGIPEKRLAAQVEERIITEIAFILKITPDKCKQMMNEMLNKAVKGAENTTA